MSPAKQKTFQAAADKAIAWSAARAPEARGGARRRLQEAGPRGLHAGRQRVPRVRAEGVPRLRPGQELAAGHAREDQRAVVVPAGAARTAPDAAPSGIAGEDPGTPCFDKLAAGCAARGERRRGLLAVMFVAFLRPDRLPLLLQLPDRLDVRAVASSPGCGWCCWGAAFVVKESEEIRFDLIYGAVGPAGAPRAWASSPAVALIVLYRASRCRPPSSYVTLHEGREDRLPQDPLRLAVLDLRASSPSPSSSATSGSCGSCCAARRPKALDSDQGELRPMNPASPFSLALVAHRRRSACSGCRSATR